MVEDEITNGVGALDVVLVAIKGFKKPWVMFCDEFSRARVSPEFVFAGGSKSQKNM